MLSGVHFLTAMIGLFAIPQIIENLGGAARAAAPQRLAAGLASLFPRLADLKLMRVPVALGSGIGASLGILPGVGGPIAAFIAYGYARRLNRGAVAFGEGAPGGIAAPESANNAVTGGRAIPDDDARHSGRPGHRDPDRCAAGSRPGAGAACCSSSAATLPMASSFLSSGPTSSTIVHRV